MNTNVFKATITRPTMEGDVCTFKAEIEPLKEGDTPATVLVKARGAAAEAAMKLTEPTAILTGQLRTPKNATLELHLSAIHPVTGSTNAVTLVGRAGQDPEVRYFESGTMVANFTLAVKGRSRDETHWFNLEIWGKQAQVAADYVRKGSLLGIIGSFKLDRWTDRTSGEERTKPVIRVDRLELLGNRQDSGESAPAAKPAASAWGGPAAKPAAASGWKGSGGAL
jgi:single-strand DNA-binding protein